MAAPSATARGTPLGLPLRDGHSTLITFATDTTIEFWEKTVQPPGIDGGDPVDATTMHNTAWRVQRPSSLKTLTEMSATVAYDPVILTDGDAVAALINVETTITVTHPDGSTWAFYGYLRSFTPTENSEGTQPEADIVVQPTNWDSAAGEEQAPVVVSVGTV